MPHDNMPSHDITHDVTQCHMTSGLSLSPILLHTCNIKICSTKLYLAKKNLYRCVCVCVCIVRSYCMYIIQLVSPLNCRGWKQLVVLLPLRVLPHRQPWTRQGSQEL